MSSVKAGQSKKEHCLPFAACGSKIRFPVQLADAVLFGNEKSQSFVGNTQQTLHD